MPQTVPFTPAFPPDSGNPNLVGLTKREYFGGLALQGMLANGGAGAGDTGLRAVRFADELIASLNEEIKQ
ncbi:MAG: hypothetical protein ABI925_12890 [Verrucomicrobiota bacterium]